MPNWSLRSSLASDSPQDFSGDQANETFNRKKKRGHSTQESGKDCKGNIIPDRNRMTTLKGWFREKELNRVGLSLHSENVAAFGRKALKHSRIWLLLEGRETKQRKPPKHLVYGRLAQKQQALKTVVGLEGCGKMDGRSGGIFTNHSLPLSGSPTPKSTYFQDSTIVVTCCISTAISISKCY